MSKEWFITSRFSLSCLSLQRLARTLTINADNLPVQQIRYHRGVEGGWNETWEGSCGSQAGKAGVRGLHGRQNNSGLDNTMRTGLQGPSARCVEQGRRQAAVLFFCPTEQENSSVWGNISTLSLCYLVPVSWTRIYLGKRQLTTAIVLAKENLWIHRWFQELSQCMVHIIVLLSSWPHQATRL